MTRTLEDIEKDLRAAGDRRDWNEVERLEEERENFGNLPTRQWREYWNRPKKGRAIAPQVDLFLDEIDEVCRRHGFAIAHEDNHGAFEIVPFDGTGIEGSIQLNDPRLK